MEERENFVYTGEIQVWRKNGKVRWMIQGQWYWFKHLVMPRLLTNGSWILTHILILCLISSKLHTFKSHIHCESHRYNVYLNWCWDGKIYATIWWMNTEISSHNGQRNDHCMHTVLEIEVHWSLHGYAWIECLGIASSPYSPYSESELHSSMLYSVNVSFQDFLSSNFTLDGNWFPWSIFRYEFWRPKHTS